MAFGRIEQTLRPIKIAFLVPYNDKKAVEKAITLNNLLWGGIFNPIIPVFPTITSALRKNSLFGRSVTPLSLIKGYLDNYDPDFVVKVGNPSIGNLELAAGQEFIKLEEIWNKNKKEIGFGVSIFEVLEHFYKKELKYKRRIPIQIYFPKIGKKHRLFLMAYAGYYPKGVNKIARTQWSKYLGGESLNLSLNNISKIFSPQILTPRRLSRLYIDLKPRSNFRGSDAIFVFNSSNTLDILDYWNLRAIGWNIFPLPVKLNDKPNIIKDLKKFVDKNYFPYRSNNRIFHSTQIIASRTLNHEKFEEVRKSWNLEADKKTGEQKTVISLYPRIWEEWAWDKDGVENPVLEADSKDYDLSSFKDNRLRFKTIDPEFASQYGGSGASPRFANEIKITTYHEKKSYAEIIPPGGKDLRFSVEGLEMDYRFSNRGIVYLSKHKNWNIHFELPLAEKMMKGWLKEKGWKTELSTAGIISKELLSILGGTWGLNLLTYKNIVEMINRMAGGNRALGEILSKIKSIKPNSETQKIKEMIDFFEQKKFELDGNEKYLVYSSFWPAVIKASSEKSLITIKPRNLMERLLKSKMFEFGVEAKCPTCGRKSWYPPKSLSSKTKCPKCLSSFSLPTSSPKELQWAYKVTGPFSIPGLADGAYSVLLTLYFFSDAVEGLTTPLLSFNAEKDGKKIEVDLALFFRESRFSDRGTKLIFCECKSFSDNFEKKDIDKMEFLGKTFPGSMLVFSTLKENLSAKEKMMLKKLVEKNRNNLAKGTGHSQIIILTGNELFGETNFPYTWEKKGGIYEKYSKSMHGFDGEYFSSATQEIYLGVEDFGSWFHKLMDNRKKILAAKTPHNQK